MKKKAGQGRFRLCQDQQRHITGRQALRHVVSGFLVDQHMWSSAEPSSVVHSIRTRDGHDARELRYAAAVATWMDWTFQPARGAETRNRVEHGILSPRPDHLAR